MTAEQAWTDHGWGIELQPESVVYHYEEDGFIVAVGVGYDGIWDCDIIHHEMGYPVAGGQGKTAQEALDEAQSRFAEIAWV